MNTVWVSGLIHDFVLWSNTGSAQLLHDEVKHTAAFFFPLLLTLVVTAYKHDINTS